MKTNVMAALSAIAVVSIAGSAAAEENCGCKARGTTYYRLTDIGALLKTPYSDAPSINNRGQVIVNTNEFVNAGGQAYIYKDRHFTKIPPAPIGGKTYGNHYYAINELGKAVGLNAHDPNDYAVTMTTYLDGKLTTVGASGLVRPHAINDRGVIVGSDGGRYIPNFPVVLIGGVETSLANMGFAYAVNKYDYVVGEGSDPIDGSPRGFISLSGKKPTFFGPKGIATAAFGINDRNQIVGSSGNIAFLMNPGKPLISLGRLYKPDTFSGANAINNCGQIVGIDGNASYTVPFIYINGKMTNLGAQVINKSAFTPKVATDINDHGEIVGTGTLGGQTHAFIMTPVK